MTDLARLGLYVDSTGVVRATDHMGKFAREGKRAEGVAGAFGKTGKAAFGAVATAAAGAVAAIASIGSAVAVIRQFDSSMSQVAAITGATRGELESLRDVAKELGSTTEFSAAQAADGLRFLGMAGFSAAESMKAIPAVLDLATASSMGLAESADIASNVLSGFGLEAGQAAQVADVLAAASSSANTSVSQLGRAMSTVAPISAALGIDLADTAAAIGVLSDAGIQGERAGTALRGVMASLAGPTTQAQQALAQYGLTAADVNPETQSLTEIFGVLAERGLTTADAMTIFGREAASGALVLADASDRVGEFGDELRASEGAAADMAGIMRDNLAGSANSALSALQGLAIAIGEAGLAAVLRAGLDAVAALARGLTRLAEGIGAAIDFVQRHTSATETVTEAMREQERQAGNVEVATNNVATASQGAAEAALQEARAQMAKIDAWREWRAEAVRASDEYQRLQNAVDLAAAELDMLYQLQSQNGGEFAPMTAEAAAAMDELKTQLVLARAAQDELLESANYTSSEYNKLQRDVDRLEAELKQAAASGGALVDGIIPLPDIITEGGNAAAILSANVASINFSAPIEGARRLARNLEVSLHQAMQMMGLLGATAQAGRDEVIFDPRDPRYDAAAAEQAARLERISNIMDDLADSTTVVVPGLENTATAIGSAGSAAGGASSAVEELNTQIEASNPLLEGINDAFGKMIDYMFDGFKDGMAGIWRIFTNTLKQMAATALKNRITIGLGLSATGVGGAAAAGVPGGGGLLGGLLGGGGGLLSGIGSGLGGVLSGGGLASSFANLGGMLSGSVGITGGAIGAALPALGVIAAPFAIASFFKSTKEIIGNGVALQMEGAIGELQSFEKSKKVYGWGSMSSGFKRDYERMDDVVQNVLSQRIDNTLNALEQFGLNTDLTGFSYTHMTPTLKEGEDPAQAIEDSIQYVLSEAINYLTGDAVHQVKQAGENLASALDRLVLSFNAVNEGLYLLGQNMLPMSLSGAQAAAALLELTGGLDQFNAKIGNVFSTMLTDTEQKARLNAIAMTELQTVFDGLGEAIPQTHAAFMDLLDAQDLTTENGRQTYAALLDVSGAFVQLNGTAQEAADAAAAAAQSIGQATGAVTSLASAAQQLTRRDVIDPGVAVLQARATEADSAVSAAEDALRAAFEAQAGQINATAQSQIDRVNQEMNLAKAMVENANARAKAEADAAIETLRETQSSTITMIREATAQAVEQFRTKIDTAQERVALYRSMSNALEGAFTNRRVLDALGMRNQGAAATAFLRSALMAGGTDDLAGLERALDVVADPATALFKSFADYQQDYNVNTNLIEGLRDLTNGQLTIEERSLAALEAQLDATQKGAEDQIAALEAETDRQIEAIEQAAKDQIAFNEDAYNARIEAIEKARDLELEAANEQMNALLGIDTSVMSVEDAIENLNAALAAQAQAQAALNVQAQDPTEFTAGSFAAQLDAIFREELGRGVRQSGLEYYGQQYIGGTSIDDIRRIIAASQEAQMFDATGVPMFEGGGYTGSGSRSGGLDGRGGFMAMLHPQETVIDHTRQRGGGNAELVAEVRALRQRNEEMAAEIRQIRRFAQSRTDIIEEQRAEELQAAAEAAT